MWAIGRISRKLRRVEVDADGNLLSAVAAATIESDIFTFADAVLTTQGAAAVKSSEVLPASTLQKFTPWISVKSTAAAASTFTVTFEVSCDDGVTWAPMYDSAGNAVSYVVASSSASVPVLKAFPPVEVTADFVRASWSCATTNGYATIKGAWRL